MSAIRAVKAFSSPHIAALISTIRSPQILELSGIGKREILEAIGVPVKVELPGVGENLQEHVVSCVAYGESPVMYMCHKSQSHIVTIELRDDVEIDTLELLHDPAERKRHLELQYVAMHGMFRTKFTALCQRERHRPLYDGNDLFGLRSTTGILSKGCRALREGEGDPQSSRPSGEARLVCAIQAHDGPSGTW